MSSSEADNEVEKIMSKQVAYELKKSSGKGEKKLSTKNMIITALKELNTRKGVSLYAIKKYLKDKYDVDTEKNSYLIKKQIKLGIEDGTMKQTRGMGASGSFKLIDNKEVKDKPKETKSKPESKKKKVKDIDESVTEAAKVKKSKLKESKQQESVEKKTEKKTVKINDKSKKVKRKLSETTSDEMKTVSDVKKTKSEVKKTKSEVKKTKSDLKNTKNKGKKNKRESKNKKSDKMASEPPKTPAKAKAIGKRKSIGSIIKPPKMKPKAVA